MGQLRAGAAQADMTPHVGILMAGGWQPKPAEGIETPLMAHALVLDDGATRIALIGLDLAVLLAKDANAAKARIEQETGIPPENVLVACSHTHEGPYPCPLLGTQDVVDQAYMARVVDAIVESATQAAACLGPTEVGFGARQVPGICQNRRRLKGHNDVYNTWMLSGEEIERYPAAGPVDDGVTLLAVRRPSGEPLAALWNYSLHAHAFWAKKICADYPYYTAQKLREKLDADMVCVFTAGACGDVNRRRDVAGPAIVDKLSEALAALYGELSFTADAALSAKLVPIQAELRDFSVFQEEEIRRKLPSALEVARQEWEMLRQADERTIDTVVQALAVGDFGLACVPGEYFVALGLDVKSRSPFALTAVAELSNDYVGYIPTSEAFDQGGYELFNVRSSKVARGTGERMADTVVQLLEEIHRPAGAG